MILNIIKVIFGKKKSKIKSIRVYCELFSKLIRVILNLCELKKQFLERSKRVVGKWENGKYRFSSSWMMINCCIFKTSRSTLLRSITASPCAFAIFLMNVSYNWQIYLVTLYHCLQWWSCLWLWYWRGKTKN